MRFEWRVPILRRSHKIGLIWEAITVHVTPFDVHCRFSDLFAAHDRMRSSSHCIRRGQRDATAPHTHLTLSWRRSSMCHGFVSETWKVLGQKFAEHAPWVKPLLPGQL